MQPWVDNVTMSQLQIIPITSSFFTWWNVDSHTSNAHIKVVCEEVVHWRGNIALCMATGKQGKAFLVGMVQLFTAYAQEHGSWIHVTLKAISTVMSVILSQKPHHTSKAKDRTVCLLRYLESWNYVTLTPLWMKEQLSSNASHGMLSPPTGPNN